MPALSDPAAIIRQVVADSNRTQNWWATQLGYSKRTFNLIHNGHQRVSPEFAVRFERLAPQITARGLLRMQADMELNDYLDAERERCLQQRSNGNTSAIASTPACSDARNVTS